MENQTKCCATCEYCLAYPRGNRFGDVDYLCVITGYFVPSINKDIRTVRHFSPGGKELECRYQRKGVKYRDEKRTTKATG